MWARTASGATRTTAASCSRGCTCPEGRAHFCAARSQTRGERTPKANATRPVELLRAALRQCAADFAEAAKESPRNEQHRDGDDCAGERANAPPVSAHGVVDEKDDHQPGVGKPVGCANSIGGTRAAPCRRSARR